MFLPANATSPAPHNAGRHTPSSSPPIKLLLQFTLTLWTQHIGSTYFRDEFYYIDGAVVDEAPCEMTAAGGPP